MIDRRLNHEHAKEVEDYAQSQDSTQQPWQQELVRTEPRKAVKYMAHLAYQIQGWDNNESAQNQIILARLREEKFALARAQDRKEALHAKLSLLADAYFATNVILGPYARSAEARLIFDVLNPKGE